PESLLIVSGMVAGTAVADGVATTAAETAAVMTATLPTIFLVRDTRSSSRRRGAGQVGGACPSLSTIWKGSFRVSFHPRNGGGNGRERAKIRGRHDPDLRGLPHLPPPPPVGTLPARAHRSLRRRRETTTRRSPSRIEAAAARVAAR